MKINKNLKFLSPFSVLYASIICIGSIAYAAPSPTPMISFNFAKLSIASLGIYSPSTAGKHTVDNIQAEVLARTNGVNSIVKYLNESCNDVNSSSLRLQPKFDTMFRSQGTEIFSDGTLSVNLMASYKSIFDIRDPAKLKGPNGEVLVFALPASIPANALKCGTPAFEFTGRANQQVRVQLVPARSKEQIASQEKLIKLVFDAQKKVLIVENPQDSLLLKNVNFAIEPNGTTFLPVVVYAESVFRN